MPANAPALIIKPKLADLAQRQDSTVDQLFDVMAVANVHGYRSGAAYIYSMGLRGGHILSERGPDNAADLESLHAQLSVIRGLATAIGCYEGAEWVLRHQDILAESLSLLSA